MTNLLFTCSASLLSSTARTKSSMVGARFLTFAIACVPLVGCQGGPRKIAQPIAFAALKCPGIDTASGDVRLASSVDETEHAEPTTRVARGQSNETAPPAAPASDGEPPEPEQRLDSLPDTATLSLDDLRRMAVGTNPTLRQAAGLVKQARGNWLQVGLHPNPAVEVIQFANNAPFDAMNVFVTQPIVTGNKLGLNRRVASHDINRARWEAEAQMQRVLNDVQIRYVVTLAAQRQAALAEELLNVAEEGVRISERLREGEVVSEADVLQAELQRNDTLVLLRSAQFHADSAWRQLANVVGRPELPFQPLEGDIAEPVPELEWESAYSQLIASHPLLQAARSRVAAAQAQIQRERAQPKPNVQLTAGVGRDIYYSPQFMMYTLYFTVKPPAYNRNQGNIVAAIGELRAAEREVDRLELTLRDGLADAFRRYAAARNAVEVYRDTYLPTAERNLNLVLRAYEEGEYDFLRVLTARREMFLARVNYIAALQDLRNTAVEIEGLLLIGGLDPVENNRTPSNQAGQTTGAGKFAPLAEVD